MKREIWFNGRFESRHLRVATHEIARATNSNPPWVAKPLVGFGLLVTVAAIQIAVSDWKGIDSLLFPLLVGVPTAIAAFRIWKQSKGQRDFAGIQFSGKVDREGLTLVTDGSSHSIAWPEIDVVAVRKSGLLAKTTGNDWHFLPLEFFESQSLFLEAAELSKTKVEKRRAIPLIDRRLLIVGAVALAVLVVSILIDWTSS